MDEDISGQCMSKKKIRILKKSTINQVTNTSMEDAR